MLVMLPQCCTKVWAWHTLQHYRICPSYQSSQQIIGQKLACSCVYIS
ncbi:hypothetical protein Lalb_Chr13g0296891 [Lupinus albus]|uniref:Uncharacterized protein n=1 Tax=Lupinus albus TaxID=3870 RepID=A0A6A4PIH0_LUPAL|nr:hypothetical protein Lalb_Chr13g0296891 [Lupinus albus]